MQTGAVEVWCFVFSMVWLSSGQIFQQLSDYCGTPKRATVKAGVAWVDPGCTLGRNISSLRLCSCSQAGICEFLRALEGIRILLEGRENMGKRGGAMRYSEGDILY